MALIIECLECGNQFDTNTTEGVVCPKCDNEHYLMNGCIDGITIKNCTVNNKIKET